MKKLTVSLISILISLATFATDEIVNCIPLPTEKNNQLVKMEWVSFIPIILGLIAFVLIFIKLSRYNLKEALSTDHDPDNRIPSSSRLLAFISGISAILFAFSLFVFYTFIYIRTGCFPEIESLTNSLLALGVGVVPYTINKVTGAIERKNQNN